MTSASSAPYLSLVTASRNDDHGGDPLRRTQIFVNSFARQCEKHRIPAELILVDWNPVADRHGLAAVLQLPAGTSYCTARVITVPPGLHARVKYAEKLPFFQMIAKNAGIRRARGRFILATNIDIIFSDELMAYIGRQQLDPSRQYRVDRYDIRAGLSENLTLDETIAYAWANPIRQNKRFGPSALVEHLYGADSIRKSCTPDPAACQRIGGIRLRQEAGVNGIELERAATIEHMHTNACGDFTLMAREAWAAIRGYPEFEAFSMNIDSMGLVAAHYAGYQEVSLLPPCVCFHIEHSLGSGWTPEGEKKLFNRLREQNILNPEWPVLLPLVDEMRRTRRALEFNHADWGYADLDLPEEPLGQPGSATSPASSATFAQHSGSAINPAYDLDRLTLAHERRLAATGSTAGDGETREIVQLFLPHADGAYSEAASLVFMGSLRDIRTIVFKLDQLNCQHPLRLDPVARLGVLEIASITLLDVGRGRVLRRYTGADAASLGLGGTARLFQSDQPLPGGQSDQPIYLLSTGDDPQLFLPPLSEATTGPLLLLVEQRFLAQ